jgi:hypothetical protein
MGKKIAARPEDQLEIQEVPKAYKVTRAQALAAGLTEEQLPEGSDPDNVYWNSIGDPEFDVDGNLLSEGKRIAPGGKLIKEEKQGTAAQDSPARAKKSAEEAKQYGDVLQIVQEDAEMTALPAWRSFYVRAANLRITADETWQDLKGDDLVKQRGIKLAWPILVDSIAQHVKNLNDCAARYPLFFAEHGMCTAEFDEKTGVVTIKDPAPADVRKAAVIAKEVAESTAQDEGETGEAGE